jgi:hypothetical protein
VSHVGFLGAQPAEGPTFSENQLPLSNLTAIERGLHITSLVRNYSVQREDAERGSVMNRLKDVLKRTGWVLCVAVLAVVLFAGLKTRGQESANVVGKVATDQWEYLALAGPTTTSLIPTDNPRMRKEPSAAFTREAFGLEQQLDKLGANGWELVAVAGPPTDPAYYFKRRK